MSPQAVKVMSLNNELEDALNTLTAQVENVKSGTNDDKRKLAAEILRLARKYGYD